MSCCDVDIHTLHAELLHQASEICFQLAYQNGTEAASIICLNGATNVQRVLEKYFSLVGIPIKGEQPTGSKDNSNLTYVADSEFIPETLEVYLSGLKLNGDQSDPKRDYDIITTGPNANKSFTILLDSNDPNRLACPPQQGEGLCINYAKRITFNTIGGT